MTTLLIVQGAPTPVTASTPMLTPSGIYRNTPFCDFVASDFAFALAMIFAPSNPISRLRLRRQISSHPAVCRHRQILATCRHRKTSAWSPHDQGRNARTPLIEEFIDGSVGAADNFHMRSAGAHQQRIKELQRATYWTFHRPGARRVPIMGDTVIRLPRAQYFSPLPVLRRGSH